MKGIKSAPMIGAMGYMGMYVRVGVGRSLAALGLVALALGAVGVATGAMRSVEHQKKLCETTGGGRFVKIPGFPGERIDKRLLNDIRYLRRKYDIFITDGYSLDPVHSRNGEHPIGLALDIVPNFSAGGDWDDIDRLAAWAEPRQNQPRAPFRWVGYDGDPHHGRGHHLHLSYSHSPTPYDTPAKTAFSIRCPDPREPKGGEKPGGEEPQQPPENDPGEKKRKRDGSRDGGGISRDGSKAGKRPDDRDGGSSAGGIGARRGAGGETELAPPAPERGGVSG